MIYWYWDLTSSTDNRRVVVVAYKFTSEQPIEQKWYDKDIRVLLGEWLEVRIVVVGGCRGNIPRHVSIVYVQGSYTKCA